jgi:predicted component of type VI protein secretion system
MSKAQPKQSWDEYYRTKRDAITRKLGTLDSTDTKKHDTVKSDSFILSICRELLDVMNNTGKNHATRISQVEQKLPQIVQAQKAYMDKQIEDLRISTEASNQSILDILKTIQQWIKKYERLLELVEVDYHDKLERVQRID